MTMFAVGAATHVGLVRNVNQDHILRAVDLFAVADGMGGHRGGEVASVVAIETLEATFQTRTNEARTTDALIDAVQRANEAIVLRAKDDPDLRGMGTTMCALARVHLEDGEEILAVVNVGDSRAYLLKSGAAELKQISEDHSLVQTLVRQGQLTPDEAAVHPQRNILTRALGIDQKVLPDAYALLPVKGDRYLLCSDGLFNEVHEIEMAAVLHRLTDPQEAAEELVRLANEGGGRDNISVVIVDIVDDAGHHKLLEDQSDDRRVIDVVHGGERETDLSGSSSTGSRPGGGTATATTTAPARAEPTAPLVISPDPVGAPAARPDGSGPVAPLAASPRSRFTWRVGLFLLFFFLIVGSAGYAVQWFADNSYYVGVDQQEVVIFQGHPGGFLWYQPKVAERTGLPVVRVPAEFQADVNKGKTQPSLQEARDYIARMKQTIPLIPPTTTPPTTAAPTPPTTTGAGEVGGAVGESVPTTSTPTTP